MEALDEGDLMVPFDPGYNTQVSLNSTFVQVCQVEDLKVFYNEKSL